jgi:1,4-alpha-glucan branching enzyme
MKALPKNNMRRAQFRFCANPGSEVFVCGTFNNWAPMQYPMKDNPDNGVFKTTIPLPRGRHEYKFVVNGAWCEDPDCLESVPNDCGSTNSVITV